MELLFIFLVFLIFRFDGMLLFFQIIRSKYVYVSKNSMLKILTDKGVQGEFKIFEVIEKLNINKKILTNVYLDREDGTTTEIDLIMICEKGIFVFESKNYRGWIYGRESEKMWTQTFKNGKKIRFFSPVWQNNLHIRILDDFLAKRFKNRIYSYVVFGEKCVLKDIKITSSNVHVIKLKVLPVLLDMSTFANVITPFEVDAVYDTLRKKTYVNNEIMKNHKKNIKSRGTTFREGL